MTAGVPTKPGPTKPETTKPGHGDINLGLEKKVKDRVRVRIGN